MQYFQVLAMHVRRMRMDQNSLNDAFKGIFQLLFVYFWFCKSKPELYQISENSMNSHGTDSSSYILNLPSVLRKSSRNCVERVMRKSYTYFPLMQISFFVFHELFKSKIGSKRRHFHVLVVVFIYSLCQIFLESQIPYRNFKICKQCAGEI